MSFLNVMGVEMKRILLPSALAAIIGPSLLNILKSCTFLQNYPIKVKHDQLRMLPLTMGMDIQYLLRTTGYYWEHLLIYLSCIYALITLAEFLYDRKRRSHTPLVSMSHQMFVCALMPHVVLIVMKNVYFMHEQWNHTSSAYMRQLVVVVWHNVGVVAKMRLAMHALAVFKKMDRGPIEKEALLLLVTPIVAAMILPFLTFASSLLAPLNMEKLELDQWLYSEEKKGFNEQLVVVLFEWYDITAINGYYDLNWLCFFGFLATILWLCSWKETTTSDDGSFSNVFHKNMLKLLCLTAPFFMKSALPKYHYLLWWDNHVDRSGYTFWCVQIYLHLFALISRVRLLQHIFSSFRPQT
ncbi:unnamed protein product [Orchesella dallaii]|uniref:Uncharacterized protein n=1 Tax=Orchesella dallaii TaxID=48710 RepID=A0ABP1REM2_9HEXA